MPFNWKEYLYLAQFLQNCCGPNFSDEAAQRSAVSRAYYAAFCSYQRYATVKLGYVKTTYDVHTDLRDFLKRNRKSKEASALDYLRKWRNQCDYEDMVFNLAVLTAQSLSDVEQLLNNLP